MSPHTRHNGEMFRIASVSAALMLLGASLWAGRLVFGSTPWEPRVASLLAVSLLLANAVNLVAMLLSPGRWVRNSIAALAAFWALAAAALSIDPFWVAAMLAHAGGVGTAWARPLDGWFHQAKPDRVPARATILALGLLWLPGFVAAFAIPDMPSTGWVIAGFGLAGGWAYSRAVPGAIWMIRLLLPFLGAISTVGLRAPQVLGMLAVILALTFLAWTTDARRAVMRPVPRRVETITVHPELAPPGLVEAVGYDRTGRPVRRED